MKTNNLLFNGLVAIITQILNKSNRITHQKLSQKI